MLADKSAKNSDNYSKIKEKFLDFKANLPKYFQKNHKKLLTLKSFCDTIYVSKERQETIWKKE